MLNGFPSDDDHAERVAQRTRGDAEAIQGRRRNHFSHSVSQVCCCRCRGRSNRFLQSSNPLHLGELRRNPQCRWGESFLDPEWPHSCCFWLSILVHLALTVSLNLSFRKFVKGWSEPKATQILTDIIELPV